MDVTVPFDPGAAGLVLVQASPELTSNMSFPFYKPVWTSTESLYLHSLYLYSRFLYSIHHSQSSQSVSIYDREIGAKISVSISISRFLRLENLLYLGSGVPYVVPEIGYGAAAPEVPPRHLRCRARLPAFRPRASLGIPGAARGTRGAAPGCRGGT